MHYLILIGAWAVFCLLHSLLASDWSKAVIRSKLQLRDRHYRPLYTVVAAVTLGEVLAWQWSMPDHRLRVDPVVQLLAIPWIACGIGLMTISIRKYFYKLSGVEGLVGGAGRPILETSGVHRFLRHPLYVGTLLMIWSCLPLFCTWGNLIACIMITLYVRIGVIFEERKLVRLFGEEYRMYQRAVPMFIPFLRSRG